MEIDTLKDVEGSVAHSVVDSAGSVDGKPSLSKAFLAGGGLPVTFKDITYTVPSNRNKKEEVALLKNVSGYLRPGEMAALMGPSGSGKTTLLDIIAGRKTVGSLSGEIKFAGTQPSQMFLRRFTGYVEQSESLLDMLTVQEMLLYTAELKRPVTETYKEKKEAVDELIDHLALTSCRDVRIGSAMARGISGGQAKRVNIGIALVSNPRVLFLDEPTSGLDSYTANEVMAVVKSLATDMGITVVASIHSPTSYCFSLFDRVLLLLKGSTIYFGPNGKVVADYFHSLRPALKQPGDNLAEWIVDLTTQADRQGHAEDFTAAFGSSDLKRIADAEIADQLQQSSVLSEADQKDLTVKRETVTPFWWGLKTLLQYRSLKNYQSPAFYGPRLGDKILMTLIIFTLYWQLGNDLSMQNVPNITSVLFMWCILAGYGASAYTPALVLERPLFVRERSDGLYRVITYLVAKMLEELGLAFVCSLVFSNLIWWTLQLEGSYVLFWLVYLCSLAIGIVLAYFIAAISPNMDAANAALPAYVTALLFFTGLLLRWVDIPDYWKWFGYINFLRYSWGALMKNQFEGDRNVEVFDGIPVLDYYSLSSINKWAWLGIEASFFFVFFLMAFLALSYVRHVRR